jgi:Co/Zn/Cd efflux system component
MVSPASLRRTVLVVAFLNVAYFGVEFGVALSIGSVSLLADSVDFLEDASVNVLIAVALGWSARRRASVGLLLALILLVPGVATVFMAWRQFHAAVAPDAAWLGATGFGAMAVNLACALLLVRVRGQAGSLGKAAFLSARNDVLANVAIVGAGVATALTASKWPDLAVGIAIGVLNADAARQVWRTARSEQRAAAP